MAAPSASPSSPSDFAKLVFMLRWLFLLALPLYGQPVVFLHGWGADSSFFEAQAAALRPHHSVTLMDLPGHGQASSQTPQGMPTFVNALEATRTRLKASQLILIGHSFGALVARHYALAHPTRVAALVLLDGAIFQLPPGEQDRQRWSENIARLAASFGPAVEKTQRERSISVFLSNLHHPNTPRDIQLRVLRTALQTPPAAAEATLLAMADLKLWTPATLSVPTLFLRTGKQAPPGEEAFLRSLFPNLTYKFLSGLGHYLMLDNPAMLNEELTAFLRRSKQP